MPDSTTGLEALPPRDRGESAHTHSLFQTAWWLDAVAPGAWDVCTVERGGELVARWPYVRRDRLGLRAVTQPPLTQTLGPWVKTSKGKYETMLSGDHQLIEQLLAALPSCDVFSQSMDPAVTNPLPFYWHGCQVAPRCTYRLEQLTNLDRVWADFSERSRNAIRKAEKQLIVRDDAAFDDFVALVSKTWQRQGMQSPYARELLERVDRACTERQCRRLLIAEDSTGKQHAAVYIVWDDRTAYYLIGGSDPELRASGANSLLVWHAVRFAAGVTRVFDFEGSMNQGIERFFRSFGARQITFYNVRMMSRRMRALTAARDLAVACTGYPRRWFF